MTALNWSDNPLQDAQLHIGDPKALYNILIKDQDIFEETDAFIEYVWHFIFGDQTLDIKKLLLGLIRYSSDRDCWEPLVSYPYDP